MHRDKTVARILLTLSIVRLAVAAPELIRQRYLDVDEDVTPAWEKRGHPGDTPQDLYPVPQMDNELPTTSGTLPSQDDMQPESGTPQLHNDQPQTSEPPPSQDDTSPASGDPEFHSGPPAGSNDPQLQDPPYPSWWQHTRPTGEIEQGESSSQALYPAPQMDNDRPPALGTPQLDNDRPSALGTLQLDNDPQPPSGAPHLHNDPPPALGTPQLHDDPLAASGTSSVHDDLPLGSGEFDDSYRFKDLRYSPSVHESEVPLDEGAPPSQNGAPPSHEGASSSYDAPSSSYDEPSSSYESEHLPTNSLISDAVKQDLLILGGYGATAAIVAGIVYVAHKIFNSNSDGAYVSAFFLPLLLPSH